MHVTDIDFFKDFLYRQTGLQIPPDKSFLLDSRLTPVAKKWNFTTMRSMTLALRSIPDPRMVADVVEAMVEAETAFFHDEPFFKDLRDRLIPWLIRSRRRKELNIWSAACASGQEACSIGILLKEYEQKHRLRGWRFNIFATDLSHTAIERAQRGRYMQVEIQHGMPVTLLTKYFTESEGRWLLNRDIAGMIRYETLNLVTDREDSGPFDLIVCRNVLSGFDEVTKQKVLNNLSTSLDQKAILALAPGDLPMRLPEGLTPVENGQGLFAGPSGPARLDIQTQFNTL